MGISSNSVIHFTNSLENLQGILSVGFKVKYCKERTIVKGGSIYGYVPMVSFCDIPLSELKNHISSYGSYGIGLKKEWAVKNNLNPVLYIEKNSTLGENLRLALMHYHPNTLPDNTRLIETVEQSRLLEMARYIKNYERDLERNGNVTKNYRFYNEKEWRYVPNGATDTLLPLIFTDPKKLDKANKVAQKIILKFEPNDISYVVLNDEVEISDFIIFLKTTFKKSALEDVDTLITRIITTQQIYHDF